MQADLFSPAIDHKDQALSHFARFELEQARENLTKAKSIDPYLADLDGLIALCEFEISLGANKLMSAGTASQLWHAAEERFKVKKMGSNALNFLREQIARRLLSAKFTGEGFCAVGEKVLHRGVCHLILRQWEEAHRDLLHLITTQQAHALPVHWAYFADAAFALKHWTDANLGYTYALLMGSATVDEITLNHPRLRDVLHRLRVKEKTENETRGLWPFEAWREGILEIPRGRTFLFSNLQQRRSVLGSELMFDREQRLRQFSLCLYVDQANLHDQINFDARAEMKALEPELFTAYLGEVARRQRG